MLKFKSIAHSLTNVQIQKCYQDESRFNGVYSTDNLSKNIKDGSYVLTLDEYDDVGIIGLLCIFQMMVLFILVTLELNMFLKKLEIFLEIKTCKQRYTEYKQINQ